MLYPIATVSYPLTVSLGLPYNAPIQGPMNFYQGINQYVQVSVTIPYSVPDGYSIRIELTDAQVIQGSAYANFQSLTYTTVYSYNSAYLVMSSMGPIPVGTVVIINLQVLFTSSSLAQFAVYIDTASVINAFSTPSGTNYLYYGLI
jgi:hypothetical protein